MNVAATSKAVLLFVAQSIFLKTIVTRSKPAEDGKCELVGTFSLVTQAFLGLLCLLSLIVKRMYEYPIRRTWPVWMFDVSKQVIGAMGVHVFNILLSILKTLPTEWASVMNGRPKGHDDNNLPGDPCDWYFLSIVLDCTIGVYVLYLVFRAINYTCQKKLGFTQIESGEYGPDPHRPSWRAYWKQLGIYFSALMITKFLLYGFVECFETPLLWITSKILLAWLDEYPNEFEIFVVMFVVPIVMNSLQLILVDNIIQNHLVYEANQKAHTETDREVANLLPKDDCVTPPEYGAVQ